MALLIIILLMGKKACVTLQLPVPSSHHAGVATPVAWRIGRKGPSTVATAGGDGTNRDARDSSPPGKLCVHSAAGGDEGGDGSRRCFQFPRPAGWSRGERTRGGSRSLGQYPPIPHICRRSQDCFYFILLFLSYPLLLYCVTLCCVTLFCVVL